MSVKVSPSNNSYLLTQEAPPIQKTNPSYENFPNKIIECASALYQKHEQSFSLSNENEEIFTEFLNQLNKLTIEQYQNHKPNYFLFILNEDIKNNTRKFLSLFIEDKKIDKKIQNIINNNIQINYDDDIEKSVNLKISFANEVLKLAQLLQNNFEREMKVQSQLFQAQSFLPDNSLLEAVYEPTLNPAATAPITDQEKKQVTQAKSAKITTHKQKPKPINCSILVNKDLNSELTKKGDTLVRKDFGSILGLVEEHQIQASLEFCIQTISNYKNIFFINEFYSNFIKAAFCMSCIQKELDFNNQIEALHNSIEKIFSEYKTFYSENIYKLIIQDINNLMNNLIYLFSKSNNLLTDNRKKLSESSKLFIALSKEVGALIQTNIFPESLQKDFEDALSFKYKKEKKIEKRAVNNGENLYYVSKDHNKNNEPINIIFEDISKDMEEASNLLEFMSQGPIDASNFKDGGLNTDKNILATVIPFNNEKSRHENIRITNFKDRLNLNNKFVKECLEKNADYFNTNQFNLEKELAQKYTCLGDVSKDSSSKERTFLFTDESKENYIYVYFDGSVSNGAKTKVFKAFIINHKYNIFKPILLGTSVVDTAAEDKKIKESIESQLKDIQLAKLLFGENYKEEDIENFKNLLSFKISMTMDGSSVKSDLEKINVALTNVFIVPQASRSSLDDYFSGVLKEIGEHNNIVDLQLKHYYEFIRDFIRFLRKLAILGLHHGDVHSNNVIMKTNRNFNLIDYDLAKILKQDDKVLISYKDLKDMVATRSSVIFRDNYKNRRFNKDKMSNIEKLLTLTKGSNHNLFNYAADKMLGRRYIDSHTLKLFSQLNLQLEKGLKSIENDKNQDKYHIYPLLEKLTEDYISELAKILDIPDDQK